MLTIAIGIKLNPLIGIQYPIGIPPPRALSKGGITIILTIGSPNTTTRMTGAK
jgi:hypothetical protein